MIQPDRWLKTRQVAEALGVSASTVKRWVDSGSLPAARTVGKHRLIRASEAIELARKQSLPLGELERLAGLGDVNPATIDDRLVERFVEALSEGDDAGIRGIVIDTYARCGNAAILADRLIQPAMKEIGLKWMFGGIDVYHEHRATRIVEGVLGDLNRRLAEKRREERLVGLEIVRPLAIGAAPEGTLYTIAGLLCELTLREAGWDVVNLGCNLPMPSLSKAVLDHKPRLVWLSINHLNNPNIYAHQYLRFHETASRIGAAVILGGRALEGDLRSRLPYTGFGDRMEHLSEFARRLSVGLKDSLGEPVPVSERSVSA